MTRAAIGACLSLLAFGALSVLVALLLRPLFRRAAAAEWTSGALLALRFAPTACAVLLAGGLVMPAFVRHEPHHSGERVAWGLILPAAAALAMIVAGVVRGAQALRASRRLRESLARDAEPIDLPGAPAPAFIVDNEFPLVALVGMIRPRLFLSRRVLAICTPAELAAILEHEAAHLARRDNLKQLLVRSCPDVLAWTGAAGRLEAAWEDACERAADDHGARGGLRDDLASALVKVARAVPARFPAAAPYFAFSRGDAVAARVRRLLVDGPARAGRPFARVIGTALAAAGAAALLTPDWDAALLRVHAASEMIVRLLQ